MSFPKKLEDSELLRIMHTYNPWWDTGKVPPSKALEFKRRDYHKLLDTLEDRKITAIVGPRRVGKTTLMYQLIEHIVSKIGPARAMYVSLDDPYLKITAESLKDIFELYSKYVLKEPLPSVQEQVYLFLDEVQALPGWENVLKRWVDAGYNVKFFVSGSSSANILTGATESLVGRISPRIVMPMKFLEVVRFHMNIREGAAESRFDKVNWQLRGSFQDAILKKDPTLFHGALEGGANVLAKDSERILLILQDYLIKGGYPEVVVTEDIYRSAENLRTYLNLTIYKDIVRTYKIRDPKAFEELIAILAKETSQRMNYSSLAGDLGLKRDTLKAYLYYLEATFLISESEFYSRSRVKRARREKKVYVNDPGIRNVAVSGLDEYLLRDTVELGMVAESVVADHCRRLKFDLEPSSDPRLFYWKGNKYETDIVMELLRRPVAVEVKYAESVREKRLKGLNEFIREHEPPLSLVITKDRLELSGGIVYVPLWLFLLMC
jgi:predicted AAA+ superfamily ATPase